MPNQPEISGGIFHENVEILKLKMTLTSELIALGQYLAGEFDNREQAIADPAWYVHLHLWQRPVPVELFSEPSLTLFAEQANILHRDRPYRPRIMQLRQLPDSGGSPQLEVQYFMFKDPSQFMGAGRQPSLLQQLNPAQVEPLPGCTLTVSQNRLTDGTYHFAASLPSGARCCFPYKGETRQVDLGFEASPTELFSFDKGIDPNTGKALWGAVLGPFHFTKRHDFSGELIGISDETR